MYRNMLQDHACNSLPNESCAVLYGQCKGESIVIDNVFLAQNADSSPTSFSIAPPQLLEAYGLADKNDMDIVAIFHSHPKSAAVPSEKDRTFMETNPVVWIIYSGLDSAFRAFVLESGIVEVSIMS